jgi:hypothetical protein
MWVPVLVGSEFVYIQEGLEYQIELFKESIIPPPPHSTTPCVRVPIFYVYTLGCHFFQVICLQHFQLIRTIIIFCAFRYFVILAHLADFELEPHLSEKAKKRQ